MKGSRLSAAVCALCLAAVAQAQDDYASPFAEEPAENQPGSEEAPRDPAPRAEPMGEEAWEDDPPALFQPRPRTPRNRLIDITADVLLPDEGQLNLLYLQYSRGLLPGLQLSAHFGAYLLTLLNLTAEYQFVNRPELRASVQVGAYWFALSRLAGANILQAHVTPRATVPLATDLEVNVAFTARTLVVNASGFSIDNRDLRAELALLRYDPGGAWMLEARFPLLTQQTQSLENVLGQANLTGSLLLDDLASWAVVLSRDFLLGEVTHLRLGLGYRNRPGILVVDSLGNLVLQFDLYWR